RLFVADALVHALTQKGFQLRVTGDGLVDLRVVAGGVRANGDQVAVALIGGHRLLEAVHQGNVFARHDRRHHPRDRGFDVDGRVVTGFRQGARQYDVAVQNGARRIGDRVLLVVAFRQHRIEGG